MFQKTLFIRIIKRLTYLQLYLIATQTYNFFFLEINDCYKIKVGGHHAFKFKPRPYKLFY